MRRKPAEVIRLSPCSKALIIDGSPHEEIKYFTDLGSAVDYDGGSDSDKMFRMNKHIGALNMQFKIYLNQAENLQLKCINIPSL